MGWYTERVLPKLMDGAMDDDHTRMIRSRVAQGLSGTVLDVGFGSGHNLVHLPAQVERLLAVEPSAASIDHASGRIAASPVPVEVIGADARRLPLPDCSVDAVLCTWSLCTIPDPVQAVGEACRVLRPGGRLRFVEHGLAPDGDVRRWQARLNPLHQRLVGGCTLDRDVPEILRLGGMTVSHLQRYYTQTRPKALAATYEGEALRMGPDS